MAWTSSLERLVACSAVQRFAALCNQAWRSTLGQRPSRSVRAGGGSAHRSGMSGSTGACATASAIAWSTAGCMVASILVKYMRAEPRDEGRDTL